MQKAGKFKPRNKLQDEYTVNLDSEYISFFVCFTKLQIKAGVSVLFNVT